MRNSKNFSQIYLKSCFEISCK